MIDSNEVLAIEQYKGTEEALAALLAAGESNFFGTSVEFDELKKILESANNGAVN